MTLKANKRATGRTRTRARGTHTLTQTHRHTNTCIHIHTYTYRYIHVNKSFSRLQHQQQPQQHQQTQICSDYDSLSLSFARFVAANCVGSVVAGRHMHALTHDTTGLIRFLRSINSLALYFVFCSFSLSLSKSVAVLFACSIWYLLSACVFVFFFSPS